jgi:hypothetical protein
MYLLHVVTCLASIAPSNIEETNLNVILIQGVNDSTLINFTCKVQGYPSSQLRVIWTRGLKQIQSCTGIQLEAGEVCTENTFLRSFLRFGKILKGISDGTYTCEQWWIAGGKWKERKALAEKVSISVVKLPNSTDPKGNSYCI